MGLDREWFEVFFEALLMGAIPACIGFIALSCPAGPKSDKRKFKVYPKGVESIGAAVVRVCGFNIVFLWGWGFFVPLLVSGHGVHLTWAFVVVWMLILILSTLMAMVGASSLSGGSKAIAATGFVYFAIGVLQLLVILRMLIG